MHAMLKTKPKPNARERKLEEKRNNVNNLFSYRSTILDAVMCQLNIML
jgi:hypothetical protein